LGGADGSGEPDGGGGGGVLGEGAGGIPARGYIVITTVVLMMGIPV